MSSERRLAYRLALATGIYNPDEMLMRMPFRIWREWLEYARIEPFGELRGDARMAMLASLFANAWLRGKGDPPHQPVDFMPFLDHAKRGHPTPTEPIARREKSPDELFAIIQGINEAIGGREVRQG